MQNAHVLFTLGMCGLARRMMKAHLTAVEVNPLGECRPIGVAVHRTLPKRVAQPAISCNSRLARNYFVSVFAATRITAWKASFG